MKIEGTIQGVGSICDTFKEAAVTIGTAIFWGFILMGIIQAAGLIIAALVLK